MKISPFPGNYQNRQRPNHFLQTRLSRWSESGVAVINMLRKWLPKEDTSRIMKTLTKILNVCFALAVSTTIQAGERDNPVSMIEGKFTPPDGKTLLFVGQDSDTIADYAKAFPEDQLEGITLYTTLKNSDPEKTLKGLLSKANWQSGDMDFTSTLAAHPTASLAIGLAFDQCNDADAHAVNIASGKYQKSVDKLVSMLKDMAPRNVFLRIGYEFDGPWNCYPQQAYKAAFRYIANKIKTAGATNVATVWQSASWPDPTIAGDNAAVYDHRNPEHLSDWYPGDDVVDWVAISTFYRDLSQWHYTPPDTPAAAQGKALAFARAHAKPVMIAEAAPQGYRIGEQTKSPIMINKPVPHSAQAIWQDWFIPLFAFIDENRDVIRALAYINTHWDAQPMWQCALNTSAPSADCPQGNWGDSRVQAHPYIRKQWLNEISNPDVWIQDANH